MLSKSLLQVGWRFAKAAVGKDVAHRADVRLRSERYGGVYGGWVVYTQKLNSDSVVYSCGVGEDASFDLALMSRFGMMIHAFDPTPRAVEWVNAQNLPSTFRFHHIGIADFDGTATFNAPTRPGHASYTLVKDRGNAVFAVEADVRRLSTIMDDLDHDHVDLLKMDIEGAEYDVVDDLLSSELDVRQLLVEFHHGFGSIGVKETERAVGLLRRHGYRLFSVSPRGEEYSFIHRDHI